MAAMKLVKIYLFLAFFFFFFLCSLDLLFVFWMDEEKSIINTLSFLIVLMPFIGLLFILKEASIKNFSIVRLITTSVIFFSILAITGLLEYLWVATHFHSMIGGSI